MSYRIEKIELKNFLSHKNTILEPGNGVTAILGENGAGKSSIVDALYLLLTMPQRPGDIRGVPRRELVRRGESRARLELVLRDDLSGKTISARIDLPSSDRGQSSYNVWIDGRIEATGYQASRRLLETLLAPPGLNIERFVELTGVIRQGSLSRFIDLLSKSGTRDRIRYFERMLGLEDYREAAERLKEAAELRPQLEAKSRRFSTLVRELRYRPIDKDLREIQGQIARLEMERRTIAGEVGKTREILEELEEEAKRLSEERDKLLKEASGLRETIGKLQALEDRLRLLEEEEKGLREKLASDETRLHEIEILLAGEERLKKLVELGEAVLRPLREARLVLEKKVIEKRRWEETLRDLEKMDKLRGAAEEAGKIESELSDLESEKKTIDDTIATLREKQSTYDKLETQAKRVIITYQLEAAPTIDETLEKAQQEVARLEYILENLEERKKQLLQEEAKLKQGIAELEERISLLKRATEPRCPVCGRPLGEDARNRLVGEMEEKLKSMNEGVRKVQNEILAIDKNMRETRDKLSRITRATAQLEQLLHSMKNLQPPKPGQLESLMENSMELESRIEELRARLAGLRGDVALYEELSKKYSGIRLDDARAKLKTLKEDIRRLEEKISTLSEKLSTEAKALGIPTDPDTLKPLVDEAAKKLEDLKKYRDVRIQLETRIKETMDKIEKVVSEKTRLSQQVQVLPGLKARLHEIEEELDKVQSSLEKVNDELSVLKAKVKELRAEIEDAAKLVEELKRLERKLKLLYRVRRALEEAPKRILDETLQKLEKEMSDILEEFALSYTSVEIDRDTLELRVLPAVGMAGGAVKLGLLSSGEQTAVALTYILAFRRVLGSTLGFLVLDEPTTHLDSERREILMELLRKIGTESMAGLSQLLVVTHHEEVRDAANQICLIEKENGVSRVDCEEGL